MPIVFRERTQGAPPSGKFTIDVCENVRTFVMYDDREESTIAEDIRDQVAPSVPPKALYDQLIKILGTTRPGPAPLPKGVNGGAGSLVRVMPMADPVYRSLFADDVTVRVPAGENLEAGLVDYFGLAVEPLVGNYARYYGYEMDIRFTSRPYAVVPDERMEMDTIDFVDEVGGTFSAYTYPEYKRFVFYTVKASDLRASANQNAAMCFRAPGAPGGINNTPFNGVPEMMIPDSMVVMNWYGVPRRYLDSQNSYLLKYRGRINYRDFYRWKKGTLLYLGCDTVRTYVPPQFEPAAQEDEALAGSFAREALVDLALSFIHTTRETRYPPPAELLAYESWIGSGHNLLPHVPSRGFYYGNRGGGAWLPNESPPSYFAVPFELLFTDPDVNAVGPR